MKILHIIPSLNIGGAERLVLDMCRELKQQGHEVKLVIFHDKNEYRYLSESVDVVYMPVHVRPSVLGKWDVNTEPLNQLITRFKPEVIHSHLFEAELLSREKIFNRIKYFSHCHDNIPQFRNFSSGTLFQKRKLTDFYEKQHLMKKYIECDNKFIAISNDTKQYCEQTLSGKLSRNIFLLNNAIDFERFHSVNHPRQTDSIRMVNVGSFVPKKNQLFLIEVIKELVKRGRDDVKLVMLGDGPLLKEVKKETSAAGMENHIECKGNVEAVENYLKEANLYIHSATYEPFGLVLMEAMAAGLPVISLDGRGNRDIMNEYEEEFLIKKPDASEFATKIIRLFSDSNLYNRLSRESVRLSKKYDISDYIHHLIKLYQRT
jgi:glycosyltransferase involved in cell wall biosynthesis